MTKYIIAIALLLSALPARATDVYWVTKDNHIRQQWHVEDGLHGWFQSESKKRCLAELAVFQAQANAEAAAKEDDE